jgi:hypothetical protein
MGWRRDEIWFDVDALWFRETIDGGAVASLEANAPSFFGLSAENLASAIPSGLAQSRRRRAELERRRGTRRTRAAAFVIGPAVILTLATPRLGATRAAGSLLNEDPPSRADGWRMPPAVTLRPPTTEAFAPVRWVPATSNGLPFAGSLSGGTQLPVEGPDWVTWNPVADRVPNEPHRLYGNDRVIRKLIEVVSAYRAASPAAPRVVVGDISFRGGGPMELHRSHQNGLDVDIYYPRLDGTLRAPASAGQIDERLTQELVDLFVAAGAEKIFVGYGTGLRGPSDVVIPYPNHEDHLHVRFGRRADSVDS